MATIKTQVVNGATRILTKTTGGVRRVSCSCCAAEEQGCCMYPADQFETLFQMADLPDELLFNLYSGGSLVSTYAATKNATANGIYWWDLGAGDSRALRHEGGQWVLYTAEFPNEQPPSTSLGGQRCLLDDPAFNAAPVFEDSFSDTYTLSNGTSSFVVARTGLCTWEGEGGTLYYAGGGFDAAGQGTFEWRSTFFEENGPKQSGNQNTPAGTYQDPISLGTWTVSE